MAHSTLSRFVRSVIAVGFWVAIFAGGGTLRASDGNLTSCTLGWRLSPSPSLPGNSVLNGVAAASRNDVWAVGVRAGVQARGGPTLAEHWDGKGWRVVSTPSVGKSRLSAVAAAGPRDFWAVGSQHGGPLVEHWNGKRWRIVPIASPSGSVLYDVAATSAADVWAVGGGLVEHWDGVRWKRVRIGGVFGSGREVLGVAALSARDVWAVGSFTDEGLIMHWNGQGWKATLIPVPDGGGEFDAVAAVSPTEAWAIGTQGTGSQQRPLSEHWNGRKWQMVPTDPGHDPGDGTDFSALAARTSNDVWAVGSFDAFNDPVSLIEHWNGSRWEESPNADLATDGWIGDVAVVARDDAWAVGVGNLTDAGTSGGKAHIQHYGCA